jgi:nucleoside-diphosphate-sugar epimerase
MMFGFIGSCLVQKLLEQENVSKIWVVDNLITGKQENLPVSEKLVFVETDMVTFIQTTEELFDIVISLVAQTSVPETVENPLESNFRNVTETLQFIDRVMTRKHKPVLFLWFSSSAVYSAATKATTNCSSPYAIQKRTIEDYLEFYSFKHHVKTICYRPFNVFGKRQNPDGKYPNLISSWGKALATGQPLKIYGTGEQKRDFISVDKVCNQVVKDCFSLIKHHMYQTKDLGSGVNFTVFEILSLIREEIQQEISVQFFPERHGDIKETLCTQPQIQDVKYNVGQEIVSTLQWYIQNHVKK